MSGGDGAFCFLLQLAQAVVVYFLWRWVMKEFENALVVEFPLRGEWQVPSTPGKSVPSHGTDQLGQRYAFDFVQVNWARKDKSFACCQSRNLAWRFSPPMA